MTRITLDRAKQLNRRLRVAHKDALDAYSRYRESHAREAFYPDLSSLPLFSPSTRSKAALERYLASVYNAQVAIPEDTAAWNMLTQVRFPHSRP